MSAQHRELWQAFCTRHGVGVPSDVPLFRLTPERCVDVGTTGNRRVLLRSELMEELVRREVGRVVGDFESGRSQFDGVLYLCYRRSAEGSIVPLYIGKAEKFGKGAPPGLSVNLAGRGGPTSGKFARWGYGRAYHMGDLSAAVLGLQGRGKVDKKYESWALAMFADKEARKLNWPVYFWMKAWNGAVDVGPWVDFGPASLTFAEYLAIGVASSGYPDDILNVEGVNRG